MSDRINNKYLVYWNKRLIDSNKIQKDYLEQSS